MNMINNTLKANSHPDQTDKMLVPLNIKIIMTQNTLSKSDICLTIFKMEPVGSLYSLSWGTPLSCSSLQRNVLWVMALWRQIGLKSWTNVYPFFVLEIFGAALPPHQRWLINKDCLEQRCRKHSRVEKLTQHLHRGLDITSHLDPFEPMMCSILGLRSRFGLERVVTDHDGLTRINPMITF